MVIRFLAVATIGQRIRELREAQKWGVRDLARKMNVSHTTVGLWESGTNEPNRENLDALAAVFGVERSYLLAGIGSASANVVKGPTIWGLVPLIDWRRAGEIVNDRQRLEFELDAKEFIPCPVIHGPMTFALRVAGDSMASPFGLSYQAGAVIFVDPDGAADVKDGDRVVALLEATQSLVFKVYVTDGGRRMLRSLNPAYPMLDEPFEIVGRVLGQFSE